MLRAADLTPELVDAATEALLMSHRKFSETRLEAMRFTKQPVPRPVPLTGVDGEPVRYPVRAFIHTWGELTEWWTHYDPDQLAAELTDEQIAGFLDTAEGTSRFAEELRAARDRRAADDAPAARGHLRAL